MYILKFDGMLHTSGTEPMPISLLGYGWVLEQEDRELARGFGLFLRRSRTGSNIAEYLALIDGMETLLDLRMRSETIQVRGDAKCVIDQMTGDAGVSSPLTCQFNQRARTLANRFSNLTWLWVPRRENSHADRLSRRGFHYLRYSPELHRKIKGLRTTQRERLVPLVDLRVHNLALPQGR